MELRVRVGAATTAQFDAVFRSLPAVAKEANHKVTADARVESAQQSAILKNQLSLTKANFQELIRETGKVHDQARKLEAASHETRLKLREQAAKKATTIEVVEATARAKMVADIEIGKAKETARKERDLALLAAREQALAARGGGGGAGGGRRPPGRGGDYGRDMPYRMGYWASRNLSPVTPMLSFAHRMGSDILRGTGIDFNVGSMVGQQLDLQKRLTELSNQGYQENKVGKGPRGTRVDVSTLDKETRDIGKTYGFDYNEVAKATTKFVDLTGNLEQARASMAGLARLSNATATDLTDMSSAAAAVAVQLDRAMGDDTKGKATALQNIMRSFGGLGKEGAVEIKDLAPQMAKIAVMAPKFSGGIESVFADLGVLAQESRKAGGSASASQAATSIARFGDLMINPKTQKAFSAQMEKAGMAPETLFADKEKTKLRPIEEIILTAMSATKGSLPALQGLFKNVMANRAIQGFANIYNTTKGTDQEKLAAVHAEYTSLKQATITAKEEEENNARVMATAAKKAQVFQDKLQDIVGEMADKVIPSFEKLAPKALEVMEGFTKMTGFLAENPLAIIPVMLGAAIAKAGVEQGIRVGIESLFRNFAGGNGSGGSGVLGGQGVMGNLAAAGIIASLAITTVKVGEMYIDNMMDDEAKKQKTNIEGELNVMNVESEYDVAARQYKKELGEGAPTKETTDKFNAAKVKLTQAATHMNTKEEEPGVVKKLIESVMMTSGDAEDVAAVRADERRRHDEMIKTIEYQSRILAKLADGVKITSLPPASTFIGPPLPPAAGGTTNTGAANP